MNRLPHHDATPQPDDADTLDLMRLWNTLWRAKWMIALLILATCGLTFVALQLVTPQYKATASLVIAERNPQVLAFQQLMEPGLHSIRYLHTLLGPRQPRALAQR